MGTICSTSRSIHVRENRQDNTCNPTPRKQHTQGDASYTHNYSPLLTDKDNSLMVANKYALDGSNDTSKENKQHFVVTVEESKRTPVQQVEQPDLANAESNTSPTTLEPECEDTQTQLNQSQNAKTEEIKTKILLSTPKDGSKNVLSPNNTLDGLSDTMDITTQGNNELTMVSDIADNTFDVKIGLESEMIDVSRELSEAAAELDVAIDTDCIEQTQDNQTSGADKLESTLIGRSDEVSEMDSELAENTALSVGVESPTCNTGAISKESENLTQNDTALIENTSIDCSNSPTQDTGTIEKSPVQDMSTIENSPVQDTDTIENSPVQDTGTIENSPVQDTDTIEKSPAQDTSTIETKPVQDTTFETKPVVDTGNIENSPAQDTSTIDTKPVQDTGTIENTQVQDTDTNDTIPLQNPNVDSSICDNQAAQDTSKITGNAPVDNEMDSSKDILESSTIIVSENAENILRDDINDAQTQESTPLSNDETM